MRLVSEDEILQAFMPNQATEDSSDHDDCEETTGRNHTEATKMLQGIDYLL